VPKKKMQFSEKPIKCLPSKKKDIYIYIERVKGVGGGGLRIKE